MDEKDFPAIYACADESSTRAQRRFLLLTAVMLGLLATAAVMGAIDVKWAGWAGAGAFAGAILLGALAVTQNLQRTWYDGRALAESTKSLTWLYVSRGGPFAGDDTQAEEAYKARLQALRSELRQLDFTVASDGTEISEAMRALRGSTLGVRRGSYERERLQDQIDYYRRRGQDHARQARYFQAATWAAQALGLVGAVLKATSVVDVDLLGIGAACAAALTAWLQTRDHVTLARAYELTAEDLDRVRRDGPLAGDEARWSAYVADAEVAMSREHVMWVARRGRFRSDL
jgi:hypothetical protein